MQGNVLGETAFNPRPSEPVVFVQVMWVKAGMTFRWLGHRRMTERAAGVELLAVCPCHRAAPGHSVFVVTGLSPGRGEEREERILCLPSSCHVERAERRLSLPRPEGDILRKDLA